MHILLLSFMLVFLMISGSVAAEKQAIKDIDIDAFTKDTQVLPAGSGDDHLAFVWWVPNEFWQSILARDATTSEHDKQAMLDALSGVSLFVIVQADITTLGTFQYYSKAEIEKNMSVSFTGSGGKVQRLQPVQEYNPDLGVVLGIFEPILGAAMGNMGSNMHFYVFNDRGPVNNRLLDPYLKGIISVQLLKRNKEAMTADIEMPLNVLFVPRKCPNGKDAHITWRYCPWSGKELQN